MKKTFGQNKVDLCLPKGFLELNQYMHPDFENDIKKIERKDFCIRLYLVLLGRYNNNQLI